MPIEAIATSKPAPDSTLLAMIEDDGISGYLHLYRITKKKKRLARVWLYNRCEAPALSKATTMGVRPHWPAPKALITGEARCQRPEKCNWTFLWDLKGKAVAIAQDGRLLALLDLRTKGAYCRNLRHSCGWGDPWAEAAYHEVVAAIRPPGTFNEKRDRLTGRAVAQGLCYLEFTSPTRRKVCYGRAKHLSKMTLKDHLRYPIWISAHDERHDEEWLRPVREPNDVTADLVNLVPTLTVRVEGTKVYGIASYTHEGRCLRSVALCLKGRWRDLDRHRRSKGIDGLTFPLTLTAIPTILGRQARFVLKRPGTDAKLIT